MSITPQLRRITFYMPLLRYRLFVSEYYRNHYGKSDEYISTAINVRELIDLYDKAMQWAQSPVAALNSNQREQMRCALKSQLDIAMGDQQMCYAIDDVVDFVRCSIIKAEISMPNDETVSLISSDDFDIFIARDEIIGKFNIQCIIDARKVDKK